MPKVSEQYKQDQRTQILDAARRCFVRNGFHRTSMQDVFAEAGKSAGAVYRYFPSKQEMIVAVAERNLDEVGAILRAALSRAGADGPGEVLAQLLAAVTRRQEEDQLAAMALMVWSESLRNPDLADRLRAAMTAMTTGLAELIGRRQARGALLGAPAEDLAGTILSVLPGHLLGLAVLGPRPGAPDAVRVLFADGDVGS